MPNPLPDPTPTTSAATGLEEGPTWLLAILQQQQLQHQQQMALLTKQLASTSLSSPREPTADTTTSKTPKYGKELYSTHPHVSPTIINHFVSGTAQAHHFAQLGLNHVTTSQDKTLSLVNGVVTATDPSGGNLKNIPTFQVLWRCLLTLQSIFLENHRLHTIDDPSHPPCPNWTQGFNAFMRQLSLWAGEGSMGDTPISALRLYAVTNCLQFLQNQQTYQHLHRVHEDLYSIYIRGKVISPPSFPSPGTGSNAGNGAGNSDTSRQICRSFNRSADGCRLDNCPRQHRCSARQCANLNPAARSHPFVSCPNRIREEGHANPGRGPPAAAGRD